MRGLGKQLHATLVVLISSYLVALPCSFYFGVYCGWGVRGLWFGCANGMIFENLIYYILLTHSVNWRRLALEVSNKMRVKESMIQLKVNTSELLMLS